MPREFYTGRSRQGAERAIGSEAHDFIWGSQAKARLVNSNQKEWSFGKFHLVLSEKRPWKAKETVDHKGHWGSHIRNLHLFMSL